MLNEELECQDICGDGIIVNSQCDDGNTISGDGCSSKCLIEYGWVCPVVAQPCKNIVPPTFSITANSPTNQHFVQFSVVVNISSNLTIAPPNMIVEIDGDSAPYIFDWRVIHAKG